MKIVELCINLRPLPAARDRMNKLIDAIARVASAQSDSNYFRKKPRNIDCRHATKEAGALCASIVSAGDSMEAISAKMFTLPNN